MCDCFGISSRSVEAFQHDGLSRRAYPGEGDADIGNIMSCILNHGTLPIVLEIPHSKRLEAMGLEGYARFILDKAKECLEK